MLPSLIKENTIWNLKKSRRKKWKAGSQSNVPIKQQIETWKRKKAMSTFHDVQDKHLKFGNNDFPWWFFSTRATRTKISIHIKSVLYLISRNHNKITSSLFDFYSSMHDVTNYQMPWTNKWLSWDSSYYYFPKTVAKLLIQGGLICQSGMVNWEPYLRQEISLLNFCLQDLNLLIWLLWSQMFINI